MTGNSGISRRNFAKRAGLGLGALGLVSSSSVVSRPDSPDRIKEKKSPREAWVLSISRAGLDEKDIIGGMLGRIERMSSYKPDVICLPEVFANTPLEAEEVPGPITHRFASVAKELGSYIVCPLHTRSRGKVFNSAVLIGRDGEIIGQYDKIHPVSNECANGVTPGSFPPKVFDTDFGKIGLQICFDVNWSGEWRSLKEQGAEIVFWPSMFPGGRMLSALAGMYKFYVVGSSWRDPSTIHDITGDLVAASGNWEHWTLGCLNLEKALLEIVDYQDKLEAIKKKYGRKVRIRYFGEESWVTLESLSPDLPVKSVLDEYGLLTHWDYMKLEEALQNKYRGMNDKR